MILLGALLVLGAPADDVARLLEACRARPTYARCLAPHVDLARYASGVLADVARTSTVPVAPLSAQVAARVEVRLRALLAEAPVQRPACQVDRAASALDAVVVRCGERHVRLLGEVRRGRFVIDDVEVDGARVSRSHRAELNKAVRRWGVAGVVARAAQRSSPEHLRPLELWGGAASARP